MLNHLNQPRTPQELVSVTGLDQSTLGKVLGVFHSLQLISVLESTDDEEKTLMVRDVFPFESLTPEIRKNGLSDKIETLLHESSFASEQFKSLKVRLSEASSSRPLRVITISSSLSGDGKSLVGINLAASFSKDPGRRVIIIDCDLRKPNLHKFLGT